MANGKKEQMRDSKDTITKIVDIDGTPILEIGLEEYTVRYSDGSIRHRRISENITGVCGTVWNPASKEAICVCAQCRAPSFYGRPTHGLVAEIHSVQCTVCGQRLCLRHAKRGRDGRYRCLEHHRMHRVGAFLRPIVFEREED